MSKYYSETNPAWTGVQVGTIAMMPKDSNGNYYAPDGWQECNGRSLNPNEFLALYQIIGNTYGGSAGDEASFPSITGSFNVPDLRDRRPVGTGRLRPEDASSPQLEDHDSGDTDTCGSYGGQNVLRLPDVAPRVQVVGSPNISYNTSRTAQSSVSLSGGHIVVDSGALSNHTANSQPTHDHGNATSTTSQGGSTRIDRTNPGNGDTGFKINPRGGPSYTWPDQAGAGAEHSHWISFKSGITGTVSYHRGWGDSIGNRGQNSHISSSSAAYGFNSWYNAYCVQANNQNEGNISINNGSCTIRPSHSQMSAYMQPQGADATQCSFEVGITLGLDSDPTIRPEFQETAYMIFLGVSSSAYTAPPPPADTGDNVPDAFGPLNITTSTASGTQSTSFTIAGCDAVYNFDILVTKTSGGNVSGSPINVGGSGTNSKGGYIVGDTVSMTLEGSAVGGEVVGYTIEIYNESVLVQTGYANVTYAAAPSITISASPDSISSGSSSTITYSAPGATAVDASNFGATVPTGESIVVTPTATTTYSLTLSNSYGSTTVTQDVAVTVPSAPTINLSVTPSTIDFGETANVTYSSYDATTFVSSNIPGASSSAYQSVNVSPTTTTTYTVTLSNANGSTTETAELTVNPLAVPTIDTSASSNLSINIDDDPGATLDIAVTGATSITYSSSPTDSGWDAQTSLTGTTYTTSPDATTVYTIAATNAAGTTTDTVTVTVTQLPTATLTANPAVMEIGSGAANPVSTTTLTWSSTDATTVVSSTGFTTSQLSGTTTDSFSVGPPPDGSKDYELVVSGPAGQGTSGTVTVTVNCTAGTGTTPAGYGDTVFGYLRYGTAAPYTYNPFNSGSNRYFVTGTNSSYASTTAVSTFTYGQIGTQILSSYGTIMSRKPEAAAFDGWMNAFINQHTTNGGSTFTTLADLDQAIYNDANGIGVGASNELGLRAQYGGLEGNYNECGVSIYP